MHGKLYGPSHSSPNSQSIHDSTHGRDYLISHQSNFSSPSHFSPSHLFLSNFRQLLDSQKITQHPSSRTESSQISATCAPEQKNKTLHLEMSKSNKLRLTRARSQNQWKNLFTVHREEQVPIINPPVDWDTPFWRKNNSTNPSLSCYLRAQIRHSIHRLLCILQ